MNSASEKPKSQQVSVYLVILILSAGWVVTLGWFSTTYRDQLAASQDHARAASELRHELQEVQARISEFERHLHNQTALVARLTGDIIPIQMPPEWEARLAGLEAVVQDSAEWPSNPDRAREFFQEVREIIHELPSWAEAHYLERLASLRWSALVFEQVQGGHKTQDVYKKDELLAQIEAGYNNLLELVAIAPLNHAPALMVELEEHIELRHESAAEEIRKLAMEQAHLALSNEEISDEALRAAKLWLERIPTQDQTTESLQSQLLQRIKILESDQIIRQARLRYDNLKAIATGNPDLLEHGERTLLSEISSTQAVLAFDGIFLSELDTLQKQLEAAVFDAQTRAHAERLSAEETRHKEVVRAYQAWALSQLQTFEDAYSVRRLKSRSWSNYETREFRLAMLELLKVDTRFLDWALSETFQSTLQAGHQLVLEADSTGTQLKHFINQAVNVTKVGLHDIPGRP